MKRLAQSLILLLATATIAKAQNTGIGTTMPTDQLHTTGTVRLEGYRGTGSRLMLIDSSGRLEISGGGPINAAQPNGAITDNGCAVGNGTTSTISVAGQPAAVSSSKISVRLYITHPVDAEVSVFLVAPNGAIIRLTDGNGGSSSNFSGTIFSDEAQGYITGTSSSGFPGIYKPKGTLSASCLLTPTVNTFGAIGAGTIVPNGTWALKVYDNASGNTGTLTRWEISFSGPVSFASSDDNNYVPKLGAGGLLRSSIYSTATGSLGINTTTATYPLTLQANGAGMVQRSAPGGVEVGTYATSASGWLQTYTNHPLSFSTNNGGVQMELGTGGNVGIGITGAAARLHVYGSGTPLMQIENPTTLAAGVNSDVCFKTGLYYAGLIRTRGTASNGAALCFYTNAAQTAGSLVERLTIADNGYVGINTPTPAARLDVNGLVRIEGGSPAAGRVLTATSASGDASWVAPVKVGFREVVTGPTVASVNGSLLGFNLYTELFDEANNMDPFTGNFTVPQDGLYHFDVNFRITNSSSSAAQNITMKLVCPVSGNSPQVTSFFAPSDTQVLQISENVLITAGEQISVDVSSFTNSAFVVQSSPSSTTAGRSGFSGYLVH